MSKKPKLFPLELKDYKTGHVVLGPLHSCILWKVSSSGNSVILAKKSGREEPGKSGNSGELSQTLDLLFGLGEEVFFVFPPLQVKMRSSDGQLGLGKAAVHGS